MPYEKKSLTAMREEFDAKAKNLLDIFHAHPEIEKMPADVALKVAPMNLELAEINAAIEEAEALVGAKKLAEKRFGTGSSVPAPVVDDPGAGGGRPTVKSFEQISAESEQYKAFREGKTKSAVFELNPLEMKTLLTLSDYNTAIDRVPGITPSIQDSSDISDLFLPGTTDSNMMRYYEETTFTNPATETAEGDAKPEATLGFTERTENVRKIPVWIPASEELLMDHSQMQSYVSGRLAFMVRSKLAGQVLVGDGTDPNISGILDRAIQTQAKGADPVPDAVYKAMQKVRTLGDAEPTGAVFNPNDWTDVRLLRTSDGIYIWGNPADPAGDIIWGKPVRQTARLTENTGLVGAFRPHAQLFYRQGMTVKVSTEHDDYFIKNKVAILAEIRVMLAVYRPYAFCKVTSI